jgi:ribonuclease HIII
MNKPSFFVAEIDLKIADKLRSDLEEQGFEISQPPYTVFSAKKKNVSCTLYKSGKLTVQGKEKDSFIEFYLEPQILGEFRYTNPEVHLDLTPHIGLDEAGKGDVFGPLCIAAVFADGEGIKQLLKIGVRDSKQLSDKTISDLASKIRDSYPYTVIRLFPAKYNELYGKFKNLNRMLAWTHASALENLVQKTGCKDALIDQFAYPYVMENALKQKKLAVNLTQKTHGEDDLVVAAASILARAGFVDGIKTLGEEYGIELPKGASNAVKKVGKELVAKFGPEVLNKVAKTHFKTIAEILS